MDELDHVGFGAVCWYLPAMTWKLCDIIELGKIYKCSHTQCMAYDIQIFDSLRYSNFPYGTKNEYYVKGSYQSLVIRDLSEKMEIIRNELSLSDKTPINYKKKTQESQILFKKCKFKSLTITVVLMTQIVKKFALKIISASIIFCKCKQLVAHHIFCHYLRQFFMNLQLIPRS